MRGVPGCRTQIERRALGEAIKRDILAGIEDKGTLPLRWETDTKFFNNEPPRWSNPFMPKAQMLHFPLTRGRLNRLAGVTVRTLCSPDSYLVGKMFGQNAQRVEEVEACLQMFSEIGNLEARLRQQAEVAGCTEHAVLRIRFDAITADYEEGIPDGVCTMFGNLRYLGFVFDTIHPNDFIVYPNTPYGIAHAQTVGHRYWQTVGQVSTKVMKDRYFKDVSITSSQGPSLYNSGRDWSVAQMGHFYSDRDTEWVECWEVLTRRRLTPHGKIKRYLVRLCWDSGDVLSIEEFPYLPWYVRQGYLPKQSNSWWHDSSVARMLQPLQLSWSALWNLFLYGMHVSAIPAIVGDGLPEKVVRYFAGDLIRTDGTMQPTVVNSSFRSQEFPAMLSAIERMADMTIHISGVSTGGQMKPNTTAREVAEVTESQARGENDYLVSFGSPIAEIWNIMREQLWHNFSVWSPVMGAQSGLADRNMLVQQIRWSLHGRNPETTPEMELMKLEKLLEKALMFGDTQGRIPATTPDGTPVPGVVGPFDIYEILRTYVNRMEFTNGDKMMPMMQTAQNALGPEFGPEFMDALGNVSQQYGFGDAANAALAA